MAFSDLTLVKSNQPKEYKTLCSTSMTSKSETSNFLLSDSNRPSESPSNLNAIIFVVSDEPVVVNISRPSSHQSVISDGLYIHTSYTEGLGICEDPLSIAISPALSDLDTHSIDNDHNGTAAISVWWTLSRTVHMPEYRDRVILPPGNTFYLVMNTSSFPRSNMMFAEATIWGETNPTLARMFVNVNRPVTPFESLSGVWYKVFQGHVSDGPTTQFVISVPPSKHPAYSNSSYSSMGETIQSSDEIGDGNFVQSSRSNIGADTSFIARDNDYITLWLENQSNQTLNFSLRALQSEEKPLLLTSGGLGYPSPSSYSVFFNFSDKDISDGMKEVEREGDSKWTISLMFDLFVFLDEFTTKRPITTLGRNYYPTSISNVARTDQLIPNPETPLRLAQRLIYTVNTSQIRESSSYFLRIDGVTFSDHGYEVAPTIVRHKIIHTIPYELRVERLDQAWAVWTFNPPKDFNGPRHYTATFTIDQGATLHTQAFVQTKGFPTDYANEGKFEKISLTSLKLCYTMVDSSPIAFSLWNTHPSDPNHFISFTFRLAESGPCPSRAWPTASPISKSVLMALIGIVIFVVILLLIVGLCYCIRPRKTKYLTPSEEEANAIRNMERLNKDIRDPEAAEFHKVPFLVRDPSIPSWGSSEDVGLLSTNHSEGELDEDSDNYY